MRRALPGHPVRRLPTPLTPPRRLPGPAALGRAEEVDAAGDGEVLVVMDLRPDEELVAAGLAREVGCLSTHLVGVAGLCWDA